MMASVPIALSGTPTPTNPIAFNTAFDRRGWKSFHGIPAAGETRLDINSLWASPRFNGAALPAQSQVNRYGFTAAWDIPGPIGGRRARLSVVATTCALTEPDHGVVAPTAGVELIDGVSTYRLVDRTAKYSELFLALSFLTYFLFATLTLRPIGVFRYVLLGISVSLFALLPVLIAKPLGFTAG